MSYKVNVGFLTSIYLFIAFWPLALAFYKYKYDIISILCREEYSVMVMII